MPRDPDLYDEDGPAAPPERERTPPERIDQERQPDREDERGETALVAKGFFGGKELNVGDRCEVEIAAIHDEEVSLEYIGEAAVPPEEETLPEPPEGGRVPAGAGSMAALME